MPEKNRRNATHSCHIPTAKLSQTTSQEGGIHNAIYRNMHLPGQAAEDGRI